MNLVKEINEIEFDYFSVNAPNDLLNMFIVVDNQIQNYINKTNKTYRELLDIMVNIKNANENIRLFVNFVYNIYDKQTYKIAHYNISGTKFNQVENINDLVGAVEKQIKNNNQITIETLIRITKYLTTYQDIFTQSNIVELWDIQQ